MKNKNNELIDIQFFVAVIIVFVFIMLIIKFRFISVFFLFPVIIFALHLIKCVKTRDKYEALDYTKNILLD